MLFLKLFSELVKASEVKATRYRSLITKLQDVVKRCKLEILSIGTPFKKYMQFRNPSFPHGNMPPDALYAKPVGYFNHHAH